MSQMENKPSQPGPNMGGMNLGMPMGMVGANPGGGMGPVAPRPSSEKQLLNTYIYDYFLKMEMFEVAHAFVKHPDSEISLDGNFRRSPSRRQQKHEGDGMMNGIDNDAMDSSDRGKDDGDEPKGVKDLPAPNVPKDCPGSFLLDWWCCFMDVYAARTKMPASAPAQAYVNSTQAQRRFTPEMFRMQGQGMMGGQVPGQMGPAYATRMMPGGGMMPNGVMHGPEGAMGGGNMAHKPNEMQRAAAVNNLVNRKQPGQINMNQKPMINMPRGEGEEVNGNQQRPQSPAAGASPIPKRLRIGPNGEYQEAGNNRPQGMPQGTSAGSAQAAHVLMANGINPGQLTQQQLAALQGQNPSLQQKSVQMYAQSMAAAAGRSLNQMPGQIPKGMPNMPQNAQHGGSPMMPQTSEGAHEFYNPSPGSMRPGGTLGAGGSGNHALQDYQMQLMLLEQQNKKRLMMARQEQDNIAHHADGQRQPGSFQSMSPGSRAAPSPQPGGKPNMAGTPKIPNQVGPGSPLPDSQIPGQMQQRNSPASAPGFNGGQMGQENQGGMMYGMKELGMINNPNAGAVPNGMRPPSSHPGYNGQGISQADMQQMSLARAQQAGRGQAMWPQHPGPQSQQQQPPQPPQQGQQPGGPQGQQVPQVGTPQQARQALPNQAMPPPQAPTNAANHAARTAPASPQVPNQQPPTPTQSNKAAPKKGQAARADGKKQPRPKKGASVSQANAVTPSSEPPTPTTPQHPQSFNNGQQHPRPNNFTSAGPNQGGNPGGQPAGQAAANPVAAAAAPAPIADVGAAQSFPIGEIGGDLSIMDFDNNGDNLLDNFDFDSFLNTEDNSAGLPFGDSLGQWTTDGVEAGAGDP